MAYNQEFKDLSDVWNEALASYAESTGQDIRKLPHYHNITDVMNDAQLNVDHFNAFRHPPGAVSKLRDHLTRHVEIIQGSAQLIASAATPV